MSKFAEYSKRWSHWILSAAIGALYGCVLRLIIDPANTESIPRTTLDEHVTIGGPLFDVLDGEYTIEPKNAGILLHLTSRERLSTHVNAYAGLWTDAIMRAIQQQILDVIRARCESEAVR